MGMLAAAHESDRYTQGGKKKNLRTTSSSSKLYEYGVENLPSSYLIYSSFSSRYFQWNNLIRKEYWIPTERTLFLSNLPSYPILSTQKKCREFLATLRHFFSSHGGEIEGIYLDYTSIVSENTCHHLDPLFLATNS